MIEIKENDTLWFFYNRYYREKYKIPPEPGNICNYFWKAVAGAAISFFWDLNIFLLVSLFAAAAFGTYEVQRYFGIFQQYEEKITVFNTIGAVFFSVILTVFILLAVGVIACRWVHYWNKKNPVISHLTFILFFMTLMAFFVGVSLCGKEPWSWWYLLYGFLIEIAGITVVGGTIFCMVGLMESDNLWRDVGHYYKAVKDRVCPLVDPPQSYKEAKRNLFLENSGDG